MAPKRDEERVVRCYLDLDVGDPEEHAERTAEHENAAQYIQRKGHQLGLDTNLKPSELDEEQRDLVREACASDPEFGAVVFDEPEPLRAGRLVLELFAGKCPKTCENFRCLVTGERGVGKASKKPLHYKGCRFHRVVRGFMMQGGDVVKGDGSSGDSIYGGKFNDEKPGLKLRHEGRGTLGMANSGKNSNTSQFYLTLAEGPLKQLDGKHVVFGRISPESLPVLDAVEARALAGGVKGEEGEQPAVPIVIAGCGVLGEESS